MINSNMSHSSPVGIAEEEWGPLAEEDDRFGALLRKSGKAWDWDDDDDDDDDDAEEEDGAEEGGNEEDWSEED